MAGFLLSEGILSRREDLVALKMPGDAVAREKPRPCNTSSRLAPRTTVRAQITAGSACGVCGKSVHHAAPAAGSAPSRSAMQFDPEMVCKLPPRLRGRRLSLAEPDGLHAAALFSPSDELLVLREDIGEHNAVDKVIGWALLMWPLAAQWPHIAGQRSRGIRDRAESDHRWHSFAGVGVCAI